MKFKKLITSALSALLALQSLTVVSFAETSDKEYRDFSELCGLKAPEAIPITEEEAEVMDSIVRADYAKSNSYQKERSAFYDYTTDYYYNQLNTAEKALYDAIDTACKNFISSNVDLSTRKMCEMIEYDSSISNARMANIYQAFYYSNPQYFFLANGYTYYPTGGAMAPMVIDGDSQNFLLDSTRDEYETTITSVTNSWLTEINKCSSVLEKERWIVEKICNTVTYEFTDFDQSLAGALVDNKCVCNGYSMAVTYFCNAAGIDTITVVSSNHAWNRVNLYGNWYEVDTTWMDATEYGFIDDDWYNKSHATFLANDQGSAHVIESSSYDGIFTLPDCNSDTVTVLEVTGLEAATSSDSVNLIWTAVSGATKYDVQRYSDSGWTTIASPTTASYTDKGLTSGTYQYRVLACVNGVWSEPSDTISVTIKTLSVPTNVKAVSGGGNVTITWDAVENATSYRVFRSDSLTGARTLLKVRTSLYYIDTEVDTGKTYYYWLMAYNANKDVKSAYSSSSKVTVTDDFAKDISIKSVSVLSTSATLKWDIVPGATSYRIYRRNDAGNRVLLKAQSMTEFTDTGLTKGKVYKYEIRAYSKTTGALSNWSPIKQVRPIAAPAILSGNVKGKITWEKNLYATSYRVYRADSLTGTKKLLAPTTLLTYTDKTAEIGKTYYYFVAAYDNSTGTLSAYSQPKKIKIA